jgi:hypothetical protein
MITIEELSGIIEVMTVLSEEEILDIAQELAYLRDEEVPELEDLREIIESALNIHWLKSIPRSAIYNCPAGSRFFIAGPASFGTVPPELSEIMGTIGFECCRSFDWEIVASDIRTDLLQKIEHLHERVESAADGTVVLEKAENEYSELFNQYYDSDFWLPDGLPDIGISLKNISLRLREIKESDQ